MTVTKSSGANTRTLKSAVGGSIDGRAITATIYVSPI